MTEDEVIEIISGVTTLLGTALSQYISLIETISPQQGAGVASQKLKLDTLKTRLADEKLKLQKLRDAQQRKHELEKIRRDHERDASKLKQTEGRSTQSRVALLNAMGQWIGWVETLADGRVNIYDSKHRIVARELAGLTLDRTGKLFGRGRQGLVALGQSLRA